MRVMVVEPGPNFSVADVYRGWVKGLKAAGCEVAPFNLSDRLQFYSDAHKRDLDTGEWHRTVDDDGAVRLATNGVKAMAYEFMPEVVLVVSGFYLPETTYRLMRARGAKVVLLCTESPYEDGAQLGRAAQADMVLLNDPTNLERFRSVNPATYYVPHAYDPDVHHPRPATPAYASDFCFVGTGYPSRVAFFEAVDWTGIDVALAGNWQWAGEDSPLRKFVAHDIERCLENSNTVEMYASTQASANLYRREAETPELGQGWSMGPREVELAACGTFYLTEARGENREVLPFVPTFAGPGDFGDKLRWWLRRPEARAGITAKARAAIADRTFTNHAAHLLRLLDRS